MSVEIEGATNRLTAAVLALAVEVAQDDSTGYTQAVEDVEYSYNRRLRTLLDDD
jgi:hypothetical protein